MYLRGRRALLQTQLRRYDTTQGNTWYAYYHSIRWAPQATTRLIAQRIVRNSKWLRVDANGKEHKEVLDATMEYWELWEVFDHVVYPFNMVRGQAPFVPGGQAPAPYRLAFQVPALVRDDTPFLTAVGQPRNAATQDQMNTSTHDRFTETGAAERKGIFKIYAEVYELTGPQCQAERIWLNQFGIHPDGQRGFSAGNLPAKFGRDAKELLETPSLIRFEAGTFDRTALPTAAERDFPWTSGISRYSAVFGTRIA
jgi:hypothetical protein